MQQFIGEKTVNNNQIFSDKLSQKLPKDDGTVADTGTGLIWQRCAYGNIWNGQGCSSPANLIDITNIDTYTAVMTGCAMGVATAIGMHAFIVSPLTCMVGALYAPVGAYMLSTGAKVASDYLCKNYSMTWNNIMIVSWLFFQTEPKQKIWPAFGKYNDWRIPSKEEWRTLLPIDTQIFLDIFVGRKQRF